jgi:acyl dehydratase
MLDYAKTREWHSGDIRHAYTTRDTILYALGAGFGADPLDARQCRFIYERELAAVPAMAAILATPGFWMRDRAELGIDALKVVHAEQGIRLHAPLPVAGTVIGRSGVTRISDKGEGKGATLHVTKQLFDESGKQLLAETEMVFMCRGDGGFSRAGGGDEAAPAPQPLPEGAPDLELDLPTRPDAAALYRLSGDLNPLHIDPEVAARAGFPRPILHGLATFGAMCNGVLQAFCDHDPARLAALRVRMSSPVYPGETLRLQLWRTGTQVRFRCTVPAREVVAISHGSAEIRN